MPLSARNSRSPRRSVNANAAIGSSACEFSSWPLSAFLATFLIGGSLSLQPRESSRGDLGRHFNFNSSGDYAHALGLGAGGVADVAEKRQERPHLWIEARDQAHQPVR